MQARRLLTLQTLALAAVTAVAAVAGQGCESRGASRSDVVVESPGGPSPLASTGTPGTVPAPTTAEVPVTPSRASPPPTPSVAGCVTLDVNPRRLSATWPTLLGKRVRFPARIERSLGITEALVTSGGERFVVMLPPADAWEGTRSRVFTVMGSATVNAGTGRITLPELLLAGDTCDDGEP